MSSEVRPVAWEEIPNLPVAALARLPAGPDTDPLWRLTAAFLIGYPPATAKTPSAPTATIELVDRSLAAIEGWGTLGYIAITAFALNVVVAVVVTLVLRAVHAPAGTDETIPADYFADEGDPRVAKLPATPDEAAATSPGRA